MKTGYMAAPVYNLPEGVRKGVRSSLLGIAVNLLLAVAKCLAGVIGHSFALIADGIESVGDSVSSSLVALGLWLAIKPPDENHPYGHGKAEPIAAVVVSLTLIGAAIAMAGESISEIRTPHQLPRAYTLVVLVSVILIKVLFSRYVRSIGAEIESTAVNADAWHHLSDAITSAFAFIGISIALLTDNPGADDWAALCASPIILFNGIRQMHSPIAELLDTAPPKKMDVEVRRIAGAVPQVTNVEKCIIRKVGFRYYVDLHVRVPGHLSVSDGHAIAHSVRNEVLRQLARVAEVLVHIEPA
jgi:cation diffusion facilitator family transporter